MSKIKILLADDRADQLDEWIEYIEESDISEDIKVDSFYSVVKVKEAIKKGYYDILFIDMDWTDFASGMEKEGLELLSLAKEVNPNSEVIIVTAKGVGDDNFDRIKKAFSLGAMDYIDKGVAKLGPERYQFEFTKALKNAVEKIKLVKRSSISVLNRLIDDSDVSDSFEYGELLGQSEVMRRMFAVLDKVSREDIGILLLGETGVGKTLIAKTIHNQSKRSPYKMISFNAAQSPEGLIDGELFGWEKDAHSKADKRKIGYIEAADKGTLFIDEIGTMPYNTQVKLLTVLDNHEFQRLSGTEKIKVNFRVICATNSNLREQINAGTFRRDLYRKLSVIPIIIPPLRERKEDIHILSQFFIKKYCDEGKTYTFTNQAYSKLVSYEWPGNVGELKHVIERAIIFTHASDEIDADKIIFDHELEQNDNKINSEIDLVQIDRLYELLKDKENSLKYSSMPEFMKVWGEIVAKEVITRAINESRKIKDAGILLGFYKGLDKKTDPLDYKRYEAFRQLVSTKLSIKVRS